MERFGNEIMSAKRNSQRQPRSKATKPRQHRKPRWKSSFKAPLRSTTSRKPSSQKPNAKLAQDKEDHLLKQNAMMTEKSPSTYIQNFKRIILREMDRLGRQPASEFKRDAQRALASRFKSQKFAPFVNSMKSQKRRGRKPKTKLTKKRNKLLEHVAIMKKEDNLLAYRKNFKAVILREMERLGRKPTKDFKRAAMKSMTYTRKYVHHSFRPSTEKSPKSSNQTKSKKSKKIDSKSRTISRKDRSKPFSKLFGKKKVAKNLSDKNATSLSVLFIKSSPLRPKVQPISQAGSNESILFTMFSPTPSGHGIASEQHSTHDLFPLHHKEESSTKVDQQRPEAETMMKNGAHRQDFKEIILREMDRLGRQASEEFKSAPEKSLASSRKCSQNSLPFATLPYSQGDISSQCTGPRTVPSGNSTSKLAKETISKTSKEIDQNPSKMSQNVEKQSSQFNMPYERNIISQNLSARNSASLILPTNSKTKLVQSSSESYPASHEPSTVLSPIQSLAIKDSTHNSIPLKDTEYILNEEQRLAVLKAVSEAQIENAPHDEAMEEFVMFFEGIFQILKRSKPECKKP